MNQTAYDFFLKNKLKIYLYFFAGVICALFAKSAYFYANNVLHGFLIDDAYISLRHAKNFVEGYGLTFNAGEAIEGYTNFLWTLLGSVFLALSLPVEPAMQISGAVSAILLIGGIGGLVWRFAGLPAAVIAGAGLALDDRLALFSVWGLEITFYPMLLAFGILALLRDKYAAAGVLLALAALTRMEVGLVVFIAGSFLLIRAVSELDWSALPKNAKSVYRILRPAWIFSVAFLAIFVPYFVARWVYYGFLLPNTFYAKVGGAVESAPRGLHYLTNMLERMNFTWVVGGTLVFIASGILAFLVQRRGLKHICCEVDGAKTFLIASFFAYIAYIVSVGGDHFGERFIYHMLPIFILTVFVCLEWGLRTTLSSFLSWRAENLRRICGAAAAAIIVIPLASTPQPFGSWQGAGGWASLGVWFKDHTPENAVIATGAAGAIPYFSERRTIDMLGLGNVHIAHRKMPNMGRGPVGHEKRDPQYVLDQKPLYITSWMDENARLRRGLAPRFDYRAAYEPFAVLQASGNAIDKEPLVRLPQSQKEAEKQLASIKPPYWGLAKRRSEPKDEIGIPLEGLTFTNQAVQDAAETQASLTIPARLVSGEIFYGPNLRFGRGAYDWTVKLSTQTGGPASAVSCEVKAWRKDTSGTAFLGTTSVSMEKAGQTHRMSLPFSVAHEKRDSDHGITLTCQGGQAFTIHSVTVAESG